MFLRLHFNNLLDLKQLQLLLTLLNETLVALTAGTTSVKTTAGNLLDLQKSQLTSRLHNNTLVVPTAGTVLFSLHNKALVVLMQA